MIDPEPLRRLRQSAADARQRIDDAEIARELAEAAIESAQRAMARAVERLPLGPPPQDRFPADR